MLPRDGEATMDASPRGGRGRRCFPRTTELECGRTTTAGVHGGGKRQRRRLVGVLSVASVGGGVLKYVASVRTFEKLDERIYSIWYQSYKVSGSNPGQCTINIKIVAT